MTNALIRGYTNCGFEAWTVPCLYVAGKYLRIFAIKADEGASNANGTASVKNWQEDDLNPEAEKNEKLEDAARVLNKIFTTCLSDRYEFISENIKFLLTIAELHLKSPESGVSTISSICCSRPTSDLIPSACRRTS